LSFISIFQSYPTDFIGNDAALMIVVSYILERICDMIKLFKITTIKSYARKVALDGLRRALDALYLAAGRLAGIFLILIFVLMMGLSVGRMIGVNIPAGDDLTAWSMAATVFLGLAHTFKAGEMIRVGLLIDRLTGRIRWMFEVASLVAGVCVVGSFTYFSLRFIHYSWLSNDRAQGTLPIPLWIPQLAYVAGLIILTISFVDELVHVLLGNKPHYGKEPPNTPEEVIERVIAGAL
jgi:TRAP-type C4-dicarboxylate transport system permease small subunit